MPRPLRTQADLSFYLVPVILTAIGCVCRTPALWFDSLARLAVLFCGGNLVRRQKKLLRWTASGALLSVMPPHARCVACPSSCTFYRVLATQWFYSGRYCTKNNKNDSRLKCDLGFVLQALSALWETVAQYLAVPIGQRLQFFKTAAPMYYREAAGATVCMYIVACFVAWPYTLARRGDPTAFKATLAEASIGPYPVAYYLVKMLVSTLASDAFTFWKHYCLHHPSLCT